MKLSTGFRFFHPKAVIALGRLHFLFMESNISYADIQSFAMRVIRLRTSHASSATITVGMMNEFMITACFTNLPSFFEEHYEGDCELSTTLMGQNVVFPSRFYRQSRNQILRMFETKSSIGTDLRLEIAERKDVLIIIIIIKV